MPGVLPPSGIMEVPITFYPREAMRYHEKVVFEINECCTQVVEIMGKGIELKVRTKKKLMHLERLTCYHAFFYLLK